MSTELAWAAGFFDGEGNVHAHMRRERNHLTLQMSITQKDRRPLERFARALGMGRIYEVRPSDRPWRMWHVWQLHSNKRVLVAMGLLLPYLSAPKREQWQAVQNTYAQYRAGLTFGRGYRGPKRRVDTVVADVPQSHHLAADGIDDQSYIILEEDTRDAC